jgi:hypothetical protein
MSEHDSIVEALGLPDTPGSRALVALYVEVDAITPSRFCERCIPKSRLTVVRDAVTAALDAREGSGTP